MSNGIQNLLMKTILTLTYYQILCSTIDEPKIEELYKSSKERLKPIPHVESKMESRSELSIQRSVRDKIN